VQEENRGELMEGTVGEMKSDKMPEKELKCIISKGTHNIHDRGKNDIGDYNNIY